MRWITKQIQKLSISSENDQKSYPKKLTPPPSCQVIDRCG
jgi:hypothetical protein